MPSPAIKCVKQGCNTWAESGSKFCTAHK
ncbi:hypothetical protein PENANT_c086G07208 [Penicillium antarcticum]|uniref:Uncharacterized protein n=1 Tax=Penicillium antarcticum TaxID=416450 RepID=A0A1V6PM72_9EURO|nr:hypothetical protein PENANT_c086G07208 [Penicillium antarcticum]